MQRVRVHVHCFSIRSDHLAVRQSIAPSDTKSESSSSSHILILMDRIAFSCSRQSVTEEFLEYWKIELQESDGRERICEFVAMLRSVPTINSCKKVLFSHSTRQASQTAFSSEFFILQVLEATATHGETGPERYEGQFTEEAIRRQKLAKALPTHSLLVMSAADTLYMSHDIPYVITHQIHTSEHFTSFPLPDTSSVKTPISFISQDWKSQKQFC